jgi:hypothetical protein
LKSLEGIAVHEIVVGYRGSVLTSINGIATLKNLGMRPAWDRVRLWFERIVMKLVEIALEAEIFLGPNAFETRNELSTASISLAMI